MVKQEILAISLAVTGVINNVSQDLSGIRFIILRLGYNPRHYANT